MDGLDNIVIQMSDIDIKKNNETINNNGEDINSNEIYKTYMSEWDGVEYTELLNEYNNNLEDIYYNDDDYIDYENMKKDELKHIMRYYDLNPGRKKKDEIINEINIFESLYDNIDIVQHRKRLWGYINELKIDGYLSQFINII